MSLRASLAIYDRELKLDCAPNGMMCFSHPQCVAMANRINRIGDKTADAHAETISILARLEVGLRFLILASVKGHGGTSFWEKECAPPMPAVELGCRRMGPKFDRDLDR
jgi:hypothetical protein